MPRKKIDVLTAFLGKNEVDLPAFSFGAVCKILGLEEWRLQKFLDSPRYRIKASGQIGKGQGSRKWFSTEDVYRIGIARFLGQDGFAPKLIAEILQRLDDRDLLDFDEHGEARTGITLSRTGKGPRIGYFRSGQPSEMKTGGRTYYVLDVGKLTEEIDRGIEKVTGNNDSK